MGGGIWTGDRYIPDMSTLGDFAGPGGHHGGSSDSSTGWIATLVYGGACRFEVDVAGKTL